MKRVFKFAKVTCSVVAALIAGGIISTAAANGNMPAETDADRVLNLEKFPWAKTATSDLAESGNWHGCVGYGEQGERARTIMNRATNLGHAGHYDEAEVETQKALDLFPDDVDWLMAKGFFQLQLNKTEQALSTLQKADGEQKTNYTNRFILARLFLLAADPKRAEEIVRDIRADKRITHGWEQFDYVLGLAQEKQNKFDEAAKNFSSAATFYMSSGSTQAASICLMHANLNRSRSSQKSGSFLLEALKPPSLNAEKLETLVVNLITNPSALETETIELLTLAKFRNNGGKEFFTFPYNKQLPGIQLVRIVEDKRGRQLDVHFDNKLCCLSHERFATRLKNLPPIAVPDQWGTDFAEVETVQVPAGVLQLVFHKGGFRSLYQARLCTSVDAINKPFIVDVPAARSRNLEKEAQDFVHDNLVGASQFEAVLRKAHQETPPNPLIFEEIAAKMAHLRKYDDAITAIDHMRKVVPAVLNIDGTRYRTFGSDNGADVLLIKRGEYCIDAGQYKEALSNFEEGRLSRTGGDDLVLWARAKLGLHRDTAAVEDLKKASAYFFEVGRIVKRDEIDALISDVLSTSPKSPSLDNPSFQTEVQTKFSGL